VPLVGWRNSDIGGDIAAINGWVRTLFDENCDTDVLPYFGICPRKSTHSPHP
jgi:hypothetical protein